LANEFDILILDTPAAVDTADAQAIAMRAGGGLIVARKNGTRASRIRSIAEHAIETNATIVGTVLNDF
jgi:Mrp family chromosome partitioning ATPase